MLNTLSFSFQLKPKLTSVISILNDLNESPDESISSLALDLCPSSDEESSEKDDRVWSSIKDVRATPALGLNWRKSKSYSKWLASVKIDPNNIVRQFFRAAFRFTSNLSLIFRCLKRGTRGDRNLAKLAPPCRCSPLV